MSKYVIGVILDYLYSVIIYYNTNIMASSILDRASSVINRMIQSYNIEPMKYDKKGTSIAYIQESASISVTSCSSRTSPYFPNSSSSCCLTFWRHCQVKYWRYARKTYHGPWRDVHQHYNLGMLQYRDVFHLSC